MLTAIVIDSYLPLFSRTLADPSVPEAMQPRHGSQRYAVDALSGTVSSPENKRGASTHPINRQPRSRAGMASNPRVVRTHSHCPRLRQQATARLTTTATVCRLQWAGNIQNLTWCAGRVSTVFDLDVWPPVFFREHAKGGRDALHCVTAIA